MTKKHGGSPIKTSGEKNTPTGDHGGVGKHKQEGATRVGTCPADAKKFDENFRHRVKD
jgi:hypothetical protein